MCCLELHAKVFTKSKGQGGPTRLIQPLVRGSESGTTGARSLRSLQRAPGADVCDVLFKLFRAAQSGLDQAAAKTPDVHLAFEGPPAQDPIDILR